MIWKPGTLIRSKKIFVFINVWAMELNGEIVPIARARILAGKQASS